MQSLVAVAQFSILALAAAIFLVLLVAYYAGGSLASRRHHASAACLRLHHEGALDRALPRDDQLSQINVVVQLEHLTRYSIVRERVAKGILCLAGWWFDVAAGDMYSYEPDSRL